MHPYSSMDTVKIYKKSRFNLLDTVDQISRFNLSNIGRSNFHTIDNLSITFHAFAMRRKYHFQSMSYCCRGM